VVRICRVGVVGIEQKSGIGPVRIKFTSIIQAGLVVCAIVVGRERSLAVAAGMVFDLAVVA